MSDDFMSIAEGLGEDSESSSVEFVINLGEVSNNVEISVPDNVTHLIIEGESQRVKTLRFANSGMYISESHLECITIKSGKFKSYKYGCIYTGYGLKTPRYQWDEKALKDFVKTNNLICDSKLVSIQSYRLNVPENGGASTKYHTPVYYMWSADEPSLDDAFFSMCHQRNICATENLDILRVMKYLRTTGRTFEELVKQNFFLHFSDLLDSPEEGFKLSLLSVDVLIDTSNINFVKDFSLVLPKLSLTQIKGYFEKQNDWFAQYRNYGKLMILYFKEFDEKYDVKEIDELREMKNDKAFLNLLRELYLNYPEELKAVISPAPIFPISDFSQLICWFFDLDEEQRGCVFSTQSETL